MMRVTALLVLTLVLGGLPALASDVDATAPIADDTAAQAVCAQSCAARDCSWSGEWRRDSARGTDVCDCGEERVRMVPGGSFRTEEQITQACNEICNLNEMPWNGEWRRISGGFDLCGCIHVTEYCPTK